MQARTPPVVSARSRQCSAGLVANSIWRSGGATEQPTSEHCGAWVAHCPRCVRQAGSHLLHMDMRRYLLREGFHPLKIKRTKSQKQVDSVAGQTPLHDQSSTFTFSFSDVLLLGTGPEIHIAVSSPRITFSH